MLSLKTRDVVKHIARKAVITAASAAALQIAAVGAVKAQSDATSYSYRYAGAGTIGRHEVRTIVTDQGTMVCNGGGDRQYSGSGYQPNDGVGRRFYRVPGNDQPTGGSRTCRWTSTVRPQLRAPDPEKQRPSIRQRSKDCLCRLNGG